MGDKPPICLGCVYVNGACAYCGKPFIPEPTINGMTEYERQSLTELRKQTLILEQILTKEAKA